MSITNAQGATRILYALIPLTTIIAWKTQAAWDTTTITCTSEIPVKSENGLKEAKKESIYISKELNKSLKENIHLQQELIHTNNHLTTTHEDYATHLEGVAHAIVQAHDHIRELEAENTQLKRDLSQQD